MSSVATAPRDAFGIWVSHASILESSHPFGIFYVLCTPALESSHPFGIALRHNASNQVARFSTRTPRIDKWRE